MSDVSAARVITTDPKDWPMTLFCSDVGVGQCCAGCHEKKYRITVYPYSVYSEGKPDPLPDLGLGIHAEVCCGRYEAVRELPRAFWLRLYAKKHGWSDAHTEQFVAAPTERFFRVWGEISDHYYRVRNPGAVDSIRRDSGSRRSSVGGTRRAASPKKCPSCGQGPFYEVCDGCGYGAGI